MKLGKFAPQENLLGTFCSEPGIAIPGDELINDGDAAASVTEAPIERGHQNAGFTKPGFCEGQGFSLIVVNYLKILRFQTSRTLFCL